jgi:Ca2+-binding EF-hand superfamily protein
MFQFAHFRYSIHLMLTMSSTPSKGRSLDRQITTQDVDCLREAFALFDNERKEVITPNELGKVIHNTYLANISARP